MPANLRKLRVFVASPGDVTNERDALAAIVNELNSTVIALAPERHAMIELVRWETHAYPAMGRPQAVINKQIGDYDIFVGIMWKRFGSPTGVAGSGTEEEFRRAFDRWQENGTPHVMFYFSAALVPVPRSDEDIAQLQRVVKFRREVAAHGLVWEYDNAVAFPDVVRPHLTSVLGQLLTARTSRARSQTARGLTGTKSPRKATQPRRSPSTDVVTSDEPRTQGVISIAPGRRIQIQEISSDDAFYEDRHNLEGQTGSSEGLYSNDQDWWAGKVLIDKPLFSGDDRSYKFLKIKIALLK